MEEFSDRLLGWYDQHGRKTLPWQVNRTPYRVWVSEIMLQQTQVKTVIPYFERFTMRFPGIAELASATTDAVLHQWTGLGYYARARNLHKSAKILVETRNGEMPMEPDALQALPGIGRSTANAIVAQCTGQPAAILDGNVKRVLARHFAMEGWPGRADTLRQLWNKAEELTPGNRVRDYTQAIMDLGAMVCTRSRPTCEICPVNGTCVAFSTDRIDSLPGKKPKKSMPVRETVMLFIEANGEVLLEQRPSTGLWGGLWGLPECDASNLEVRLNQLGIEPVQQLRLATFRHSFTHYHLDITPVHVTCRQPPDGVSEENQLRWMDPRSPEELGLTRPAVMLLEMLA